MPRNRTPRSIPCDDCLARQWHACGTEELACAAFGLWVFTGRKPADTVSKYATRGLHALMFDAADGEHPAVTPDDLALHSLICKLADAP